jgi:uncharacterized protein YjiS (DUF1127 family)
MTITLPAGEMPAYATSSTAAAKRRRPWWRHLALTIAAARRRSAAERQVRQKVQELRDLDDWILADMGLTRSAIEHAVRNGHPRDL